MFAYARVQQGVVSAAQYHRVDVVALSGEAIDIFLYKEVGALVVALVVLDERYPHGACLPIHMVLGVELGHLGGV